MTKYRLFVLFFSIALVSTACQNLFQKEWKPYQEGMYQYQRDPQKLPFYKKKLQQAMQSAKTPPGVYAEYGYLMAMEGNQKLAIQYYVKEKQAWPEATALMDKLIQQLKNGTDIKP